MAAQRFLQDNTDATKRVDTDLSAITTGNDRVLYFADGTMDIRGLKGVQALTAGTIAADISQGSVMTLSATANSTITFSNGQVGLPVYVIVTQDATGGRTVAFANGTVRNEKSIDTTANAVSILHVAYNGTTYDTVIENTLASRKELQDAVTFSATPTISWDADTADNKVMAAMTSNITNTTFTATRSGWYTLGLTQDGTGGRTVVWGTNVKYQGAAPQPDGTANSVTYFQMYYDSATSNFRIVSHG